MRVLVVEDDKIMANNIKMILSKEGMVVDVQSRIGDAASTHDEVVGIDATHVGSVGGETALTIDIDSSSSLTQHIQCHMVPGVVGQLLC